MHTYLITISAHLCASPCNIILKKKRLIYLAYGHLTMPRIICHTDCMNYIEGVVIEKCDRFFFFS